MTDSTSPSEERPRDRIYSWALYRISILQEFARRHCSNPQCGARDDEGEPIPCAGKECGENKIHEEHRRELRAMRDTCALVEFLERKEIEQKADDDRPKRRR